MLNYQFIISGKVQGVWYRKTVSQNAKKKGFSGYVKNLADGRVEAGAYLKDDEFALFILILEKGSSTSRVDNIEQFEANEEFSGEFTIRD
ncbi:MAG: acylphosphatase [Arcobacter sp.]|nr:MAG: acylphosphatase [Arcobacter sp.]